MPIRTRLSALVTTTATLAALLLLTASPAGADTDASGEPDALRDCGKIYFVENNSSGYGYFTKKDTPLRTEPYAKCAANRYKKGTKFFYWCYITNDHGNRWIFGRIAGSDTLGWVYSGNVTWEDGSLNHCRPRT
ncbi:hypothetical protein GL263_15255 [Streptomyces durbertensis]|uniref:SH3 domain-containing protein n=1 Tax=Streptomyces durbertensis TaxID=2448886 RepID=A0ABR6EHU2_9ACTN|nr:hypothetical protein [Streptomyces durbertensis]MBB1244912.1 hypothetical protein [Streptomyces durbertensis]